jgi:DNA-binding transcriptional MerR regulator
MHLQVALKSSVQSRRPFQDRRGRRAQRTDPSSLRYYEQIGLIPPPTRVSGRRHYRPDVFRKLAVIDTAQRAGLNLDEIRLLLDAAPGDKPAIERLREVAERKLPELRAMIERPSVRSRSRRPPPQRASWARRLSFSTSRTTPVWLMRQRKSSTLTPKLRAPASTS